MFGLNKWCDLFKLGMTLAGVSAVVAFCAPLSANDVKIEDLINENPLKVAPAFSNLLNPQPTVYTDKTSVVIPFSSRYGFEYTRTDDERYTSDLVEVSFVTALSEDYYGAKTHRYTVTEPLVLKVTLKGYSLFQSQQGEGEFFSLDRAKEREIREPQFLVSVSKNF